MTTFISTKDDISFEVIFIDIPHELAAISTRRKNKQFAAGIDCLVFLPYCDDSFDTILTGCDHCRDSAALGAQTPAGSIDTDSGVDLAFFANECRADVTMEPTIHSLRLRTD